MEHLQVIAKWRNDVISFVFLMVADKSSASILLRFC